MWVLESSSFELNGFRRYLRPGKEYLVGRAKYITDITIDSNTVSKRHAKFVVVSVEKGASLLLEEKTAIYLIDLNSKFGTIVNGEKLGEFSRKCDENFYEITFGKCQGKFRLSWNPIVFTLSGIKLKDIQLLVEAYGIKITKEYCDKTTHVVSKQRNTTKNLQAFICGVFVVSYSYVQELVRTIDLLELNFDGGFPNPEDHIPQDNHYLNINVSPKDFLPNKQRRHLFRGLTFIFFDKNQYCNLSLPINAASGKTAFCNETSNIEQIIIFMHNYSNVIAVSPLDNFYFVEMACKRLRINMISQDKFFEPIVKMDLSLFEKDFYINNDPNYKNNSIINNTNYNSQIFPASKSELNNELMSQVFKKRDINVVSNDNGNKEDIKSSEHINEVFDKNDTLSQSFSNCNKFSTKARIIYPISDNENTISTDSNIKMDPDFYSPVNSHCSQNLSSNKLNIMHDIYDDFLNTSNSPRKILLNSGNSNKSRYETNSYNCLKSDLSLISTTKNFEIPLSSTLQENKINSFQTIKNESSESQFSKSTEKYEKLKAIEYFKVELKPQKSFVNLSSRWDPKWNGRKNFKKFIRVKKTQPQTFTQHIRLVEYKPNLKLIQESNKQKSNGQIFKKNIKNTSSDSNKTFVFKNKTKTFSTNIQNYFDITQDDSDDDDPLKFRF
ncbi:hypothetical protein T552_00244 [Pneumocystis carinii B80]|uniref:FHA domain-containing protein n=1 Tax=Pneumocystis carinii (strain B80) TaxID=1408658 RepID=A0A0W4ZTC6_PNEC8|nr:hypothetical protein T552_00244 [Pneumocystis carinii B80]KTW31606.1 hypothetical protein T552_00244 [Pneumocystis carinii B80]